MSEKPKMDHVERILCVDPIIGNLLSIATGSSALPSSVSFPLASSTVGESKASVPLSVIIQTDCVLLVCLPSTKVAMSECGLEVTFTDDKDAAASAMGEFLVDDLLLGQERMQKRASSCF